jgi:hypothetical protein
VLWALGLPQNSFRVWFIDRNRRPEQSLAIFSDFGHSIGARRVGNAVVRIPKIGMTHGTASLVRGAGALRETQQIAVSRWRRAVSADVDLYVAKTGNRVDGSGLTHLLTLKTSHFYTSVLVTVIFVGICGIGCVTREPSPTFPSHLLR